MPWTIHSRMRCPQCGSTVPGEHELGGPIICTNCQARLQVSRRRSSRLGYAVLAASIAGCYLAGLRGGDLAVAVPACSLVLAVIATRLELRFCPPLLEAFDWNALRIGRAR